MKKDYIGWGIGIIGIIVALFVGSENKQLKDKNQQVYNSVQSIQQYITINNYSLPPAIAKEFQSIEMASGSTVIRK